MNMKIFVSAICATMIATGAFCKDAPENQKPDAQFEMLVLMDTPRPMIMMGNGQLPPPPVPNTHFGPRMGNPDFNHDIKLTDKQREKFRSLNDKHKKDVHEMNESRMALQERYQEKFEAVLTDEQFRKIENMRKDLRKDMKKLDEKQRKLFEEHRRDFESILTDEQKEQLKKSHMNTVSRADYLGQNPMHDEKAPAPKHKEKKDK